VEAECLDYALVNDERFGIWGNTTPKQREAIKRRLGYTTTTDEGPEPA
jgi:WhiB family redox-sensing transcriptional regulator